MFALLERLMATSVGVATVSTPFPVWLSWPLQRGWFFTFASARKFSKIYKQLKPVDIYTWMSQLNTKFEGQLVQQPITYLSVHLPLCVAGVLQSPLGLFCFVNIDNCFTHGSWIFSAYFTKLFVHLVIIFISTLLNLVFLISETLY